jgi:hypothetical protein
MKDSPELLKIEQKLKTLNPSQYGYLTFELFGWMSNDKADSKEYIKGMTKLLDGSLFDTNEDGK